MALTLPPNRSPAVAVSRYMEAVWLKWCESITRLFNTAPNVFATVSLSAQTASIAATSISAPTLTAGLYRVTVYARPTVAASVSSSLSPFIVAVESGLTETQTAPYALTANSVNVPGSWTFFQRSDASQPMKYGMTMVSVGAPALTYRMDVWLEQVPVAA